MTDSFTTPLGRDDQPTDEQATDGGAWNTADTTDDAVAPSAVDFDDHERFDVDDPAKPGIDDYTD